MLDRCGIEREMGWRHLILNNTGFWGLEKYQKSGTVTKVTTIAPQNPKTPQFNSFNFIILRMTCFTIF